jgi:hypothetical protein
MDGFVNASWQLGVDVKTGGAVGFRLHPNATKFRKMGLIAPCDVVAQNAQGAWTIKTARKGENLIDHPGEFSLLAAAMAECDATT